MKRPQLSSVVSHPRSQMVWGGPEACDRRTDEFSQNFRHRFPKPARRAQSVSLLICVCARHFTVDKMGQTGRLHHLPRCRGVYGRARTVVIANGTSRRQSMQGFSRTISRESCDYLRRQPRSHRSRDHCKNRNGPPGLAWAATLKHQARCSFVFQNVSNSMSFNCCV